MSNDEVKLGSLTYDQMVRKYPEVAGFDQSRVVLRNYITEDLYVGPIGPVIVRVDPSTTKERAIEIEAWFKGEFTRSEILIVAMEHYRGR